MLGGGARRAAADALLRCCSARCAARQLSAHPSPPCAAPAAPPWRRSPAAAACSRCSSRTAFCCSATTTSGLTLSCASSSGSSARCGRAATRSLKTSALWRRYGVLFLGARLGSLAVPQPPPLPPTCAQLHCAVLCTLLRSRCVETPARSPLQAAVPQPPPCRQPALRPVVQPPLRRDLLLQIDRCGGARRVAQHSPGGPLHGQSSAVQGATARRRLMHGCSRAPHLDTARVAPSLHIAHDHNIATGRRPQRVVGLFNDAAEPGAR